MTSTEITAFAALVLVTIFLVIAIEKFRGLNTYEEYFLASRSLKSGQNAASYVARFTSLATVLSFFLIFAKSDGAYLLISPISLVLGIIFFSSLMRRNRRIRREDWSKYQSMPDLVSDYFGSKSTGLFVSFVSLFSVLTILLIEIFVGVGVLSIYVKDVSIFAPFTVLLLCLVIFSYVAFGGLMSVAGTDRLQATLIMLFVAILTVYFVFFNQPAINNIFPRSIILPATVGFILPHPLFLNVIFVNLLLFPSLYSTWQMFFASKDEDSFVSGTKKGAVRSGILWSLLLLCGIGFTSLIPTNVNTISQLTEQLAQHSNWFLSSVIFPLFFIAALSALMSTADSAILPIVQQTYDLFFSKNNFKKLLPIVICFCLMIVVVTLYIIVFGFLKFDIIGLLFSVFGLSLSISPIILWILIFPNDVNRKQRASTFFAGAIFAFLVAIGFAIYGSFTDSPTTIQLGAPAAVIVAGLFQGASYLVVGGTKK